VDGPVTENQQQSQIKKSLRYSILDGSAYAAMLGLTQNYTTPLALALKATTTQIGLLFSIPNLLMSIAQLLTPNLTRRAGSRKGLILPVVFGHALMFIPVLLIPFLFPEPRVVWLIVFITIGSVLGATANPAWGSMMADMVPANIRGSYFSNRGRIAGFITLVASLVAGAILQFLNHQVFIGFAILFGGAAAFRFLSLFYLSQQYEPPITVEKDDSPGLWRLFRDSWATNLGKFTLFVALINFFTMLSGPFFAVFMLNDLHFSYTYYMLIICTNALSNMAFQTFWGRRADKAGNLMVIKAVSLILPLLPFTYVVSSNLIFLIGGEILSGFAWGGFNLAATNFAYDATEPATRTKQLALFNAITGLALCFGALIGGYIATHLPAMLGYQLRSLFTLSGVLRGLLVLIMLRLIVEVRDVPRVNLWRFLSGKFGR
jgi:MFS family permease